VFAVHIFRGLLAFFEVEQSRTNGRDPEDSGALQFNKSNKQTHQ
jgi:hypothetical protein